MAGKRQIGQPFEGHARSIHSSLMLDVCSITPITIGHRGGRERYSDEDRTKALKTALDTIWKKIDPQTQSIKNGCLQKKDQ
jgi:hypothetical protein